MWEIHVSGCQFALTLVKAQASDPRDSPARTFSFSVM